MDIFHYKAVIYHVSTCFVQLFSQVTCSIKCYLYYFWSYAQLFIIHMLLFFFNCQSSRQVCLCINIMYLIVEAYNFYCWITLSCLLYRLGDDMFCYWSFYCISFIEWQLLIIYCRVHIYRQLFLCSV